VIPAAAIETATDPLQPGFDLSPDAEGGGSISESLVPSDSVSAEPLLERTTDN
jgi:hypothetical protein